MGISEQKRQLNLQGQVNPSSQSASAEQVVPAPPTVEVDDTVGSENCPSSSDIIDIDRECCWRLLIVMPALLKLDD